MKKWEKSNKGFSLVELIIVISIMAILMGVVGTQVIPYLNKSRRAKDEQVLDSLSTAAISAFVFNAEKIDTTKTYTFIFNKTGGVNLTPATDSSLGVSDVTEQLRELVGSTSVDNIGVDICGKLSSKAGKLADKVGIEYTAATGAIVVSVDTLEVTGQ